MEKHINSSKSSESTKQPSASRTEISASSQWHKTSNLPDGTSLGRFGAYWYILDQNGHAISDGYHEISLDDNGDYIGTRSTRHEPVVLYTELD